MEEGERIMGMEIRPVYAGESMAWLVTSTDNTPEVWTLNKVALIRSVRPVPCWKCGYKTIQPACSWNSQDGTDTVAVSSPGAGWTRPDCCPKRSDACST